MKNLFDTKEKDELLKRLSKLTAKHQPKWGKMNAQQLVAHLADPLRAALGERPVPFRPSMFGIWPFNKFASQIMPWPKGAPTAPEFIQGDKGTVPIEFEQDKKTLIGLINKFSEHQNASQFPPNPGFGKLTNKEWARLMWRHLDHHLTQFGI